MRITIDTEKLEITVLDSATMKEIRDLIGTTTSSKYNIVAGKECACNGNCNSGLG